MTFNDMKSASNIYHKINMLGVISRPFGACLLEVPLPRLRDPSGVASAWAIIFVQYQEMGYNFYQEIGNTFYQNSLLFSLIFFKIEHTHVRRSPWIILRLW